MTSISAINEGEIKKDQLRSNFKLPQMAIIFEVKKNPIHSLPITKKWAQQAFEYSLMNEKAFAKALGATTFASYCYPLCDDIKRYENIYKLIAGSAQLDDHTECDYGDAKGRAQSEVLWSQAIEAAEKLLNKQRFVSMNGWKPYLTFVYMVLEDMCNEMGEQAKRRMLLYYQDFCRGSIEESKNVEKGFEFKNLEDMFVMRRECGALGFFYATVAYSANIELTDEQWDIPLMQEFHKVIGNIVMCDNDVLSFEKEWIDQNKDLTRMANVVACAAILDECSVDKAMETIAAQSSKFQEMAVALSNRLFELKCEAITTYVKCIQYFISGNYMTAKTIDRYRKHD